MPSYFNLFIRGFKRKYLLNHLIFLPDIKIDVIVCSPGGCGNVTLNNYLENYCVSNNFLKKNSIYEHALMHIPRPLSCMEKKKIKIILLKRDFEEIYQSHKKRGFLRNALVWYGDMFSFYKYKNENYLKKKFFRFLKQYYEAWDQYSSELKLDINYNELWHSAEKIKNFLNINSLEFVDKFPKYEPYDYKKY